MQIRFVDKSDFQICGYSIETSLDERRLFFEYYPEGVNGDYELWTPVVKADV